MKQQTEKNLPTIKVGNIPTKKIVVAALRGQRSKETTLPRVRGMEDTGQQEWKKTKSATGAREGTIEQNSRAVCPCFHQVQAGKDAGQKRKNESLKPNNWKRSLTGFRGEGDRAGSSENQKHFFGSVWRRTEKGSLGDVSSCPKPDSLTHGRQKDQSDSPLPPLLWASPASKGFSKQRRGWLPTLRPGRSLP